MARLMEIFFKFLLFYLLLLITLPLLASAFLSLGGFIAAVLRLLMVLFVLCVLTGALVAVLILRRRPRARRDRRLQGAERLVPNPIRRPRGIRSREDRG